MEERLRLEGVSKDKANGSQTTRVLSKISLSVARGDVLTVLGPSGSGKSTLLRLINRLEDPTEGIIFLDGRNTREMNVLSLRRRAGMVFQTAALFDGSVESNIRYGARLAGIEIDPAALIRRVGLSPDMLERAPGSLSGGEQQRVSIARTLATNPDLLLMDEPTSSLDPGARLQIEDLVLQMNRDEGLTIVFVTHDMEQAKRIGSRTMLLIGGRQIEEAPTEAFFATPQTDAAKLFLRGDQMP